MRAKQKVVVMSYAEARKTLAKQLNATEREFAVWVALDELQTYTSQGDDFDWDPLSHHDHNAARLARAFFDQEKVESYNPEQGYGRFLSFEMLEKRWRRSGLSPSETEALVRGLNDDARERDICHFADPSAPDGKRCPRGTLFAFDPFGGATSFFTPDVQHGMFQESQIEEVEIARGLVTDSAKIRARLLEPLLVELEHNDSTLDRRAMPGTKDEFQTFVQRWANKRNDNTLRQLGTLSKRAFDEALSLADCAFKRGTHKGTARYWQEKYPELYRY